MSGNVSRHYQLSRQAEGSIDQGSYYFETAKGAGQYQNEARAMGATEGSLAEGP